MKLGVINIHNMNIKKCNKKWGHRACLRVSGLLKCFFFYRLRVKNSNHLHTEFSIGYLEDEKFCLEIEASFVNISSIASFKLFLIAVTVTNSAI